MDKTLLVAIVGLLTAVVTNLDRVNELWEKVAGPPPPPKTAEWTHKTSKNRTELETFLERVSPAPTDLVAASSGADIHIWYRSGGSGAQYKFRDWPWEGEEHPKTNFFYNDGSIVPVGFMGNNFTYLQVTTPPTHK